MNLFHRLLLTGIIVLSAITAKAQYASTSVPVEWSNQISGDFSFINQWSYNENVFRNSFGELVCDGFCDERIQRLTDSSGKILPDSIQVYYQLLDTTHYYHTLSCKSNCSEFAGTNFIYAVQSASSRNVECFTITNASTHCVLSFTISGDTCKPRVELVSIIAYGQRNYVCQSGSITIDPELWKKGIIKAAFKFSFFAFQSIREDDWVDWEGIMWCKITYGKTKTPLTKKREAFLNSLSINAKQ
ncbi:MAG: hypothetical protein ACRC3B_20900 [Bacteroidia bacterium]